MYCSSLEPTSAGVSAPTPSPSPTPTPSPIPPFSANPMIQKALEKFGGQPQTSDPKDVSKWVTNVLEAALEGICPA